MSKASILPPPAFILHPSAFRLHPFTQRPSTEPECPLRQAVVTVGTRQDKRVRADPLRPGSRSRAQQKHGLDSQLGRVMHPRCAAALAPLVIFPAAQRT